MPEISIKAETIFHLGPWAISNSYLLSLIVVGFLVLVAAVLYRRLALVPSHLQAVFEYITEGFLTLLENLLGDRQRAERYVPLVATVFLFVLTANWFGLVPGVGSLLVGGGEGHHAVPLLRAPGADLNFTLGLAIIAVLAVQFFGITMLGLRRYSRRFFTLKNPIFTFVGILELSAELVKVISFSFRLFGNIFAGEVLLVIIGFLLPYFVPLPFLFLETFVGFIQAFIFSMLTLVFIALAVTDHEEEHEEGKGGRSLADPLLAGS